MAKSLTVKKNPAKQGLTGGHSLSKLAEQIRELRSKIPTLVAPESIPTGEPFVSLFRIKEVNESEITESMLKDGFDHTEGLIIGTFPDGKTLLVDGHTRRKCALNAGIEMVPVWYQDFESITAARQWARWKQVKGRRNLNDAELYEAILDMDEQKERGRGESNYSGKSSQRTAEFLGTSRSKVEKTRFVDKNATEEQKEAILSGEKSVNRVYQEIKEKASNEANNHADRKNREIALSEANSKETGKAYHGGTRAQDCAPVPTRDWTIEARGSKICLIRKEEAIVLLSYEAMQLLYDGAPEKQLLKAVREYMEKIL